MGQYFLIANLDKKQFIDPANFKRHNEDAGFSNRLPHLCRGDFAGVLVFLLATSAAYPYMGMWAGDRVMVIGDEKQSMDWNDESLPGAEVLEEIRAEWHDVSRGIAPSYLCYVSEYGLMSDKEFARAGAMADAMSKGGC